MPLCCFAVFRSERRLEDQKRIRCTTVKMRGRVPDRDGMKGMEHTGLRFAHYPCHNRIGTTGAQPVSD